MLLSVAYLAFSAVPRLLVRAGAASSSRGYPRIAAHDRALSGAADEHHAQARGRHQQRKSRCDAGGPDHCETRGISMAGLNIEIFNTGYRPVPSAIPVWPDDQQATWPPRPRRLSGERDGVLVDALATTGESQELADWLATTGKNLAEVYITHAHGDHFFGLNTVLDKFPKARARRVRKPDPPVNPADLRRDRVCAPTPCGEMRGVESGARRFLGSQPLDGEGGWRCAGRLVPVGGQWTRRPSTTLLGISPG